MGVLLGGAASVLLGGAAGVLLGRGAGVLIEGVGGKVCRWEGREAVCTAMWGECLVVDDMDPCGVEAMTLGGSVTSLTKMTGQLKATVRLIGASLRENVPIT